MNEFKLVEVTWEEYEKSLKKEIKKHGLRKAVQKRLDYIHDEMLIGTSYLYHMEMMEVLNEIHDLLKLGVKK